MANPTKKTTLGVMQPVTPARPTTPARTGTGALNTGVHKAVGNTVLGNQTGTPISGAPAPTKKTTGEVFGPQMPEGMTPGVTPGKAIADYIATGQQYESADPSVSLIGDAFGLFKPAEQKAQKQTTVGGWYGGGRNNALDERAAEYAQYIADAYARSQAPGQAKWDDRWEPRIEDMVGDRYRDYESRYQPQMDGLMDRLLNRGQFNYNWSDDPLYRQYAARYQQQARRGMQDAMGQAAGLTGGYGSSYAQAAGQQAYANQMEGLNDRAMELYDRAYGRWNDEGQEMRSNLAALGDMEDRWRRNYDLDRASYYDRNDADINNMRNSQALAYQIYQDQLDRELQARQEAWDQYQYWNNLYEQRYLK